MDKWRWQHQRDGRILRLYQGEREVLVIDRTRLRLEDETGVARFNTVVGRGKIPTFEDENLILSILNGEVNET